MGGLRPPMVTIVEDKGKDNEVGEGEGSLEKIQQNLRKYVTQIVILRMTWYNKSYRAPLNLGCQVTGSQREERTRTQAVAGTSYFQRTARLTNLYYSIMEEYDGR